ncbi:MAG: DUF4956 domain-containing protein [Clostridia bacterium]|nr:DUF4956 domain-containing protein [Clostridia bacterium]
MDITALLKEQWVMGNAQNVLPVFAANLVITALLAWVLGWVYGRYGESLSNRKIFARNFLMLALTTMLVISIVKSSLALSLGLVGALSIVRFRAAIKEPEELAYLFLAIGIGLGLGAGEPLLTICALVVIIAIIILRSFSRPRNTQNHVCAHISSNRKIGIKDVVDLLAKHGASASLRRFDETPEKNDLAFVVQFSSPGKLEEFSHDVRELDSGARISFVDDRGLGM